MNFVGLSLLFFLFSFSFAEEISDMHILPRPLIVQFPGNVETQFNGMDEELRLMCTSWRFNNEANNLSPWKTVPRECAEYVRDYMMGRAYQIDLDMVSKEASMYAKSVTLGDEGKDVWIFDIDETLISNLPYYAEHGYGLEVFDSVEYDKWVDKAVAPAIEPSLNLYKELLTLGFKVFLMTGRYEKQRTVTIKNLLTAGYHDWDKLILRTLDDHGKLATLYKSERRIEIETEGYRIIGNSGDQWSDLLGASVSARSFKLPNPMYYIP